MALHDYERNLAVKWANMLIKNGCSLWIACQTAATWYELDAEQVQRIVLFGKDSLKEGNE